MLDDQRLDRVALDVIVVTFLEGAQVGIEFVELGLRDRQAGDREDHVGAESLLLLVGEQTEGAGGFRSGRGDLDRRSAGLALGQVRGDPRQQPATRLDRLEEGEFGFDPLQLALEILEPVLGGHLDRRRRRDVGLGAGQDRALGAGHLGRDRRDQDGGEQGK